MAVAPADLALVVFTACNTARVFAYLPQIVKIGRDTQGAAAISYVTWTFFGVSHLSTVAYAILVVNDWRMTAVFAANTLCCVIIVSLTAWKRAAFRTTPEKFRQSGFRLVRKCSAGASVKLAVRRQT